MRMNRSGRTRIIAGGVATMLAVALAGCTADEAGGEASPVAQDTASAGAAGSPSVAPSEEAAPEYSPEEQAAIDEAKATVLRFYEVLDAVSSEPQKATAQSLDSVAIDPVKTDQLGVIGYFAREGERQVGKSVIEFDGVRAVKIKSDPDKFVYPEVVFDICTDASDIKFVDSAGKVIPSDAADRVGAVIGVYKEPGEGWFVDHLDYAGGSKPCK